MPSARNKAAEPSKKRSLSRTLLLHLILIAIASILVLGSAWIYSKYASFQTMSQSMKDAYLKDRREILKLEVETTVAYINYMMTQADERVRRTLKARVYEAHAIAQNLYTLNRDRLSPNQLRSLVKDALRPIRFNGGRGYYFATDLGGIEQLFADHPELEGRNMLPIQDATGEYVVRDMIDLVKKQDEGFYQYHWTKPGAQGNDHLKLAFVKHFEPFDWLIGTGEYIEDMIMDIQKEILARVERIRFANDGYVFVGTYSGVSLSGPAQGRNMLDLTDAQGVKIVQELIARAKEGGGYLAYVMPRFPGQKSAPKLSYAVGIPEWQWYVGSGIYVDEIDASIERQRQQMWAAIKNTILKITAMSAGLILVSLLIAAQMTRRTQAQFNTFINFLARAAETSEPIDRQGMRWAEFDTLAQSANRMLVTREEARQSLVASEAKYRRLFERSNDAIFVVDKTTGRYLDANNAALKLTGRTLADLRQLTTRDVAPHEADSRLKKLATSEKPIEMGAVVYLRPDGSQRIADLMTLPLNDRTIYGIARDITDRKSMEKALREERDKAQKYLDIAEVILVVIDHDQNVALINKKGCAILGYAEDEIVGQNWVDHFIPPEDREMMKGVFFQIMQGHLDAVEYFENSILTRNGQTRLIAWHNAVIRDDQDRLTATLSSGEDITERKRAEEAVRKSEKRYRDLADSLPQTVFETDAEGALTFVNEIAFKTFGYDRDDLNQGLNALEMLVPEEREKAFKNMLLAMSGELQDPIEYKAQHKDGRSFPIVIHASPITQGSEVVGLRGIIIDQTRQKKLEAQLQQAQKMEAIGTLAGGIAHDFNNILSALIGYTELSLDGAAAGSALEKYLQEVFRAAMRAKDLVRQILTFARKVDETLKPVKVSVVAKEVLKLLRSTLPTSITIRPHIASEALVMADLTQMHQIFMNLCTNAAYAMEEDGGQLEVTITDCVLPAQEKGFGFDLKSGEYVKITIADTGKGIEPGDLPMIFEPYFSTKPSGEGTGLGLSVVHGIVKGYKGDITVKSEAGRGTVFTIYLPTIKMQAEMEPPESGDLPMGDERILFIDDEASVRDVGSRILEHLGYRVTSQTSSKAALALFRSRPYDFDMVITDMTMPEMSGDKLASELIKTRADIPIILCTGYSKMISDEKATALGIKAFAMKPLAIKDLAQTIRRVLDKIDHIG